MTSTPHANQLPKKRQAVWIGLLSGLALLLGLYLGWLGIQFLTGDLRFNPPPMHGMVINSADPMTDFTLTDSSGALVSLSDFRGKVVMVYFGYTFCPDVCPTTLVELARMEEKLGTQADEVEVIMVSLDPQRDTPEKLGEYMAYFDPSFIGMTGSEADILAAATEFGVFYNQHEGTAATGYLIDHTATVMLLDKQGKLSVVYPFGITGPEMAEDAAYFVKQ